MIRKLSKHAKYSSALVIPPVILELLKWDQDTELEISIPDGKTLVIKKHESQKGKKNGDGKTV